MSICDVQTTACQGNNLVKTLVGEKFITTPWMMVSTLIGLAAPVCAARRKMTDFVLQTWAVARSAVGEIRWGLTKSKG